MLLPFSICENRHLDKIIANAVRIILFITGIFGLVSLFIKKKNGIEILRNHYLNIFLQILAKLLVGMSVPVP